MQGGGSPNNLPNPMNFGISSGRSHNNMHSPTMGGIQQQSSVGSNGNVEGVD